MTDTLVERELTLHKLEGNALLVEQGPGHQLIEFGAKRNGVYFNEGKGNAKHYMLPLPYSRIIVTWWKPYHLARDTRSTQLDLLLRFGFDVEPYKPDSNIYCFMAPLPGLDHFGTCGIMPKAYGNDLETIAQGAYQGMWGSSFTHHAQGPQTWFHPFWEQHFPDVIERAKKTGWVRDKHQGAFDSDHLNERSDMIHEVMERWSKLSLEEVMSSDYGKKEPLWQR